MYWKFIRAKSEIIFDKRLTNVQWRCYCLLEEAAANTRLAKHVRERLHETTKLLLTAKPDER